MTKRNTRRGFTLIELLVVVLIIGILAAVAVPQYQKAVAKARATEIVLFDDAVDKALDLYLLKYGKPSEVVSFYTKSSNNLDELDIDIPLSGLQSKGIEVDYILWHPDEGGKYWLVSWKNIGIYRTGNDRGCMTPDRSGIVYCKAIQDLLGGTCWVDGAPC